MAKLSLSKLKLDQAPSIRERIVFIISLVGVLILFVNIIWSPISNNISTAKAGYKAIELQVDTVKKLIDATNAQVAAGQIASKTKETPIGEWVKRVLGRSVADVTQEITATVDQLGSRTLAQRVKVVKVDIGSRVEQSNYVMVPIMIELEGQYTGIQTYIESVERLERPIVVSKLDVEPIQGGRGKLGAKVEVELYAEKR